MAPLLMVAIYNENTSWALDEKYVEEIRSAAGNSFEVFQARSRRDVDTRLPDTEIMFGWKVNAENLLQATRLAWVQATGAGVEHALFGQFVASPIVLTNASGIHAPQISEQAIGMMIALTRRLPYYLGRQAKKRWDKSLGIEDLGELYEKTLGIIGLGAIGEALALRAKAFGMRVVGVKRSPLGYSGAADEVVGPAATERTFRESDYVVCLLPMTPSTDKFVSAEMIAAMKPSAFFLNFGRGATVDEAALVEALSKGAIAGSGLDVFAEEPLGRRSKLWKMENVIITPHVAGLTKRYWQRATDLFCGNLRRYIAGEELANVVDKELGY